jgi:hypothetical protein
MVDLALLAATTIDLRRGATGTALLGLGVLVVGDLDRTTALVNVVVLWTFVLGIDFLISFRYTLWPRQPRATSSGQPCHTT